MVGILLVPVLMTALFVWAFMAAQKYFLGKRGYASLGALRDDVSLVLGMPGIIERRGFPLIPLLDSVRFEGELPGARKVRVTFEEKRGEKEGWQHVLLAVALEPGAPELRITLETAETRRAKLAGQLREIEIDERAFDDRFLIEAPTNPEGARTLLRSGLGQIVAQAFDELAAVEVAIRGGELVLTADAGKLDPTSYTWALGLLQSGARFFERIPLVVKNLGERRAYADGAGRTRCAYCHDAIQGEDASLVACERCATVLHDGCWQELGRCPLLGCGSRRADGERTRR